MRCISTFYRSAQRQRRSCSTPPEWMLNPSGQSAQSQAEYSSDKLTRDLVTTFIDRIEIGEQIADKDVACIKKNVPYHQTIDIYYRYIGSVSGGMEISPNAIASNF